jgi:hypothetical protein
MSDSMGNTVYKAAEDGNDAELKRLIKRGGSVNWHNPDVRHRVPCAHTRLIAACAHRRSRGSAGTAPWPDFPIATTRVC